MLFFFALVWFVVALLLTVDRHYELWKHAQSLPNTELETPIKHKSEKWIRLALFVPTIVLLSWQLQFTGFGIAASFFFVCCWIWFLFDGFFNKKRGFNWWYIGTVDKDESGLDDLKRELGPRWTKILQIGLCVLSTIFYVLLWIFQ